MNGLEANNEMSNKPRTKLESVQNDLRQLKLLLWKNFTIQKRSVIGTILEILVPTLFVIILLPIRSIVKSEYFSNDTTYAEFSFDHLPFNLRPLPSVRAPFFKGLQWTFAYQPNTNEMANRIMQQVGVKLGMTIVGFESESEMVSYLQDPLYTNERLGGISFINGSLANFTYSIRLSYAPRNSGETDAFKLDTDWKTQFIYDLFPVLGPREKESNDGGLPGYRREGFLAIQKAVDLAFISEFNSSVKDIEIKLKRFPFPPYNDDQLIIVIQTLLPFMTVLSFIFTVIITAKSIVHEKETGVKEAMKLMGMKTWIYWLSWYIRTMLLLLPSLIFIIVSYKVKIQLKHGGKASIIDKTDPALFALFMFLYASCSVTFTFLCSTFFKKANSAAAGAGIIWFFSYLPYIFISLRYEKMSLFDKIISLIVNNLALSEGIQLIGQFEGKGTGINFKNWTSGISVDDNFSMIIVMAFMILNHFIHLSLMWYFDQVIPGDHGIARPWYFPFSNMKAFLFPDLEDQRKSREAKAALSSLILSKARNFDDDLPVYLEDESIYSSKKIGISITNLSKEFTQFGKLKKAVDDLSLNIYEGQISVLLGHNGAGKSTTISMITGLAEPTNGKILINDLDIVRQTKEARQYIGFCPQYNLLFDDMTVYEHLKFFAKLKRNFDEKEIDNMLEIINLADKKHALAKTLSGGMKRKLSVAIAFIGKSSIVILDEPSSGMDPQARHSTWSLLQKFKKERKCTILLTTHFMDEADFLGDRIAIMSKGSLRCCGSPLFLKSMYSSGYNLVLTKKQLDSANEQEAEERGENDEAAATSSTSSGSRPQSRCFQTGNQIASLIHSIIPEATLHEDLNSEISFILPAQQTAKFSELFEKLDEKKENLNIDNIGISISTLEDVFLKIGNSEHIEESDDANLTDKNEVDENSTALLIEKSVNNFDSDKEQHETLGLWVGSKAGDLVFGMAFIMHQLKALFVKRIIHSIRNKVLVIVQICVPIGVLLIDLFYVKFGPVKAEDSPQLMMGLNRYRENYAAYQLSINDVDPSRIAQVHDWAKLFSSSVDVFPNAKAFDLQTNDTIDVCQNARGSIDQFISCVGRLNTQYIYPFDTYILAADFILANNISKIVGHFNNQPLHVPPLILNLITNSLYKYYSNSSNNTLTVINHPLPRRTQDELSDLQLKDPTGFNVASGTSFGFSFLIASFVIFIIKERVSNSKHIQFLSGCNSYLFWISAFLWDMLNYIITSILVICIIKAFGIEAFVGQERLLYIFGLLMLYGVSHIPQMYLLSYFFQVSATGFASLVAWNILTSQATLTPVQILTLPQLGLVHVSEILEWVFIIIFPNFSIGQGLADLYSNYQTQRICQNVTQFCQFVPNPCCLHYNTTNPNKCGNGTSCFIWTENLMDWQRPGLLRFFVFMSIQFIVQFLIVLLIDAGYLRVMGPTPSIQNHDNSEQAQMEQEYGDVKKDEDVCNEERRIANKISSREYEFDTNKEIFLVDRLTKYYSGFMAVKGISFSMRHAECFGLLGVNGAGKTTTFKMITGDVVSTFGNAYLNRISLKSNFKKFQRQLGYCPQFDPLIDQMTVLETMRMFAYLRGIKENLVDETCLSLISLLDLSEHTDKMCYTLSGGNKRKLSVAISLVGSPAVVLLDEPTSGMDPKTRRTLWNCLNKIRSHGKSLILTTHAMDETEVLCTNIGIMVNGELKCLGSLQHLKSKYGEGYTLLAKINLSDDLNHTENKVNTFLAFIMEKFPNSALKESRDGYINIHISDNSTRLLSELFSVIENCKEKFSIEYYVVTQTNLEQIFLNFASKQIDPETRILKKSGLCC